MSFLDADGKDEDCDAGLLGVKSKMRHHQILKGVENF